MSEKQLQEIEARMALIAGKQWGLINSAMMSQIEADVPALIAALREAKADSDRMEWLEKQYPFIERVVDGPIWRIYTPKGSYEGPTFRETIDRAMAAEALKGQEL